MKRRTFISTVGATAGLATQSGCLDLRSGNGLEVKLFGTDKMELAGDVRGYSLADALQVGVAFARRSLSDLVERSSEFDYLDVSYHPESIDITLDDQRLTVRSIAWDQWVLSHDDQVADNGNLLIDASYGTSPILGMALCKRCGGPLCDGSGEHTDSSAINYGQELFRFSPSDVPDQGGVYDQGVVNRPFAVGTAIPHELGHNLCARHLEGSARREGSTVISSLMMAFYIGRYEGVRNLCSKRLPELDWIRDENDEKVGLNDRIAIENRFSDCVVAGVDETAE